MPKHAEHFGEAVISILIAQIVQSDGDEPQSLHKSSHG